MKANVHVKYGAPSKAKLTDIPIPSPDNNELLIKVISTSVNRTDCGLIRAEPFISRFVTGLLKPKRTIMGNEFSGVIEYVGKDVKEYSAGEEVFGITGNYFGAHAEYMVLPETAPFIGKPKNISFQEAGAIGDGLFLAYTYIKLMDLNPDKRILINGTTGAIGSSGLQLAKYFGAHISAVANTRNLELVKSLGADVVINYETDDFTKIDDKFDFVFDAVGKSTYGRCKNLLKKDAVYFSTELGPWSQNPFLGLVNKQVNFPIPLEKKEDFNFFKQIIEEGKFRPIIDRTYKLDDILEAYNYVETGEKTGNVVISVA